MDVKPICLINSLLVVFGVKMSAAQFVRITVVPFIRSRLKFIEKLVTSSHVDPCISWEIGLLLLYQYMPRLLCPRL